MKKLFQYAVILHKFEQETSTTAVNKKYVDSEVIIEPTILLAKDEKEVLFKVTRLIPEDKASDPENVQIVIRNF